MDALTEQTKIGYEMAREAATAKILKIEKHDDKVRAVLAFCLVSAIIEFFLADYLLKLEVEWNDIIDGIFFVCANAAVIGSLATTFLVLYNACKSLELISVNSIRIDEQFMKAVAFVAASDPLTAFYRDLTTKLAKHDEQNYKKIQIKTAFLGKAIRLLPWQIAMFGISAFCLLILRLKGL